MILSPLNLVFILIIAGFVIGLFSKKAGRSLSFFGIALFITFGLFPVGHNALVFLENRYERPAQMPDQVDGIVILGGAFVTNISHSRGITSLNDASERVIDGLALANNHPHAIVMFSGGYGGLGEGKRTEAQDAEQLLANTGFPPENVFFEDESKNTYQNIRNSLELMIPQPQEKWYLVTSAYHMPRAMAVARRSNWGEIIAYPADYRTSGKYSWRPSGFDILTNMKNTHIALHELLGITAYQITGKISLSL